MKRNVILLALISALFFGVNIDCHAQARTKTASVNVYPAWTGVYSTAKSEYLDCVGAIERITIDISNTTQAMKIVTADGYALYGPATNNATDIVIHAPKAKANDITGTTNLYYEIPGAISGAVISATTTNWFYEPVRSEGVRIIHWGAVGTNQTFKVYITTSER